MYNFSEPDVGKVRTTNISTVRAHTVVSTLVDTLHSHLLINHSLHPHQADLPKPQSDHLSPAVASDLHDSFFACFSSLLSYPE